MKFEPLEMLATTILACGIGFLIGSQGSLKSTLQSIPTQPNYAYLAQSVDRSNIWFACSIKYNATTPEEARIAAQTEMWNMTHHEYKIVKIERLAYPFSPMLQQFGDTDMLFVWKND